VAGVKQLGATCMDISPSLEDYWVNGERFRRFNRDALGYPANPDYWNPLKTALVKHGVRCDTYGDMISDNMESNRFLFKWMKTEHISYMRVSSSPEMLAKLEPLVEEYQIPVVVHNHGPTDKYYQKITAMVDALKNRHPLIGACVDVGHFWRGGEDPVEALEALGDRVLRIHLKDQASVEENAVIGEGQLDIPAILRTLQKIKFSGPLTLEYEAHPENPIPYMEQCLVNLRRMFADMG